MTVTCYYKDGRKVEGVAKMPIDIQVKLIEQLTGKKVIEIPVKEEDVNGRPITLSTRTSTEDID
ncbi:hypothetical protein IRB23SM22_11670 [Alkalibacterium sp. s-m-22]